MSYLQHSAGERGRIPKIRKDSKNYEEFVMTIRKLSKSTILLISALAYTMSGNVVAGNTADKRADAGFDCFNAGPSNFTHCLRSKHFGNPAVPVKVFSEDGLEFLGTELLLHPDIYNWQPCPQDGLEFWDFNVDAGYFACHHFNTGHHSD